MNPQLIEKVIKSYNESCPELTYKNSLLDPNVTKALSKSFVKVLTSKQSTNVHNNLRLSVLENIRKICKLEPEGHVKFRGNHSELLMNVYKNHTKQTNKAGNEIDRELSAFLMRTFKNLNIKSSENIIVNPEIIQALINLDNDSFNINLLESLIHWNSEDKKCLSLLNNLWNPDTCPNINDIVIKIKPELETILLKISSKSLEDRNTDLDAELLKEPYKKLTKTCSVSPYCFQICSNILNSVFISTNYDSQLLKLITKFVTTVKLNCKENSFLCLYETRLNHIVVLLDIDLSKLPGLLIEEYIKTTVRHLKDLQKASQGDFVLLLSHFPQWFNLSSS